MTGPAPGPASPTAAFREALAAALRVPFPVIVIASFEEDRALGEVERAAAGARLGHAAADAAGTQAGALASLRAALAGDAAISTFFDLHRWFDDPEIVRTIRAAIQPLEAARRTLVFIQPVGRIPMELDRDAYVLSMPLPGSPELRAALDAAPGAAALDSTARAAVVGASKGLTLREAARAYALLPGAGARDAVAIITDEKRRLLRQADTLEITASPTTLDDVGGLDMLKSWLRRRETAFSDEARAYGLPAPRGLLLLGVQGCGKSLSAKAVAALWRLPIARLDLGQLFRGHRSPEEQLGHVLRLAESMAPLVLWIDEIDKSFAGVGGEGSETLHRVFGAFITWMQEKGAPVFVVATANAIDHLPPELLRKGRFDEIFFVDLPDIHERRRILAIHLAGRGRAPEAYDLDTLAARSEHHSGAELEQAVVTALHEAFADGREVEQADLLRAVTETVPLYFTYGESIKELRDWARRRARMASADSRILDLFKG